MAFVMIYCEAERRPQNETFEPHAERKITKRVLEIKLTFSSDYLLTVLFFDRLKTRARDTNAQETHRVMRANKTET